MSYITLPATVNSSVDSAAHVHILTGPYAGQTLPVLTECRGSIRCALPAGGTVTLPKASPLGVRYFEEVQP